MWIYIFNPYIVGEFGKRVGIAVLGFNKPSKFAIFTHMEIVFFNSITGNGNIQTTVFGMFFNQLIVIVSHICDVAKQDSVFHSSISPMFSQCGAMDLIIL